MTIPDHDRITSYVLTQIAKQHLVNKPYLIRMIQYISKVSESEANEIIERMVVEKEIDEHMALSKNMRPYSFYTAGGDSVTLNQILTPLLEALHNCGELSISYAAEITGYSELVVRTLLTHLLLECVVDYKGDLESPTFYLPWDEK